MHTFRELFKRFQNYTEVKFLSQLVMSVRHKGNKTVQKGTVREIARHSANAPLLISVGVQARVMHDPRAFLNW